MDNKITMKELEAVILKEIVWHEDKVDSDMNLSKDYNIGFIAGLKQALFFVQTDPKVHYPTNTKSE